MILPWLRKNLFRSVGDSVISLIVGAITFYGVFRFLRFVFVTARWDIVKTNLSLFVHGSWPQDTIRELAIAMILFALLGGLSAGYSARLQREDPTIPPAPTGFDRVIEVLSRIWPMTLAVILLLALTETIGPLLMVLGMVVAAVIGRFAGERLASSLKTVVVMAFVFFALILIWFLNQTRDWDDWGGMMLNVFLAALPIILCFPIGVLMAVGRRSEYPIVRMICTIYIEVFRGMPLISLLLMANVALGFFIPNNLAPDKIVRALVILTLFTSAYVAEIVRGGLQSVARGQIEAGKANGLSPIRIMTKIVLPQAIRNVIPALVGQFISLFKDTTLVGAVMGVTDLLAASDSANAQDAFRGMGLVKETLTFALFLFWAGSYTMSQASARLETRLGVGQR